MCSLEAEMVKSHGTAETAKHAIRAFTSSKALPKQQTHFLPAITRCKEQGAAHLEWRYRAFECKRETDLCHPLSQRSHRSIISSLPPSSQIPQTASSPTGSLSSAAGGGSTTESPMAKEGGQDPFPRGYIKLYSLVVKVSTDGCTKLYSLQLLVLVQAKRLM